MYPQSKPAYPCKIADEGADRTYKNKQKPRSGFKPRSFLPQGKKDKLKNCF